MAMRSESYFYLILLCAASMLVGCREPISSDETILAQLPETVDFNYHIRPVLSDRCFACHGPDENARATSFRLDTEEGAFGVLTESNRRKAIVRGNLRRSEIAHRIGSVDADYMMPPPESNLALSDYEIALLRKWIAQGAEWRPHWAFVAPQKAEQPEVVDNPAWNTNPIDRFVMAKLNQQGLTPSPEAEKEALLRRVTFDLTGLPPSLEDIDTFLADTSEDAYEHVVDRLLASKAYAERMTVLWMDISRYADSHGYHADGSRMMWPWRDWVIEAYDTNMPFDEFVTLQLAGDLVPDATQKTRLATGFNRNHQMTAEGGVVDEEYRLEYVADRTNTVASAFLGLTMECAKCHDHKFDPISQEEYYQFSAFFNNINEVGMIGDDGNAGPVMLLIDEEQQRRRTSLRDSIRALELQIQNRIASLQDRVVQEAGLQNTVDISAGLIDHYPLNASYQEDETTLTANTVEGRAAAMVSGEMEPVKSPVDTGMRLDYDYDYLELRDAGIFERYEPFSIALWAYPEKHEAYATLFSNTGNKNSFWRGYEAYLDSLNRVNVRIIHAFSDNQLHVRTTRGIALDTWAHIAMAYDGSSDARGIDLFIDGVKEEADILFSNLYKSIKPVNVRYDRVERPVRIGKSYRAFSGDDGIFTGRIDDIRIYRTQLTPLEVAVIARKDIQQWENGNALVKEHEIIRFDTEVLALDAELRHLREKEHELIEPIEEIMVMREMEVPRNTYVLERGLYDQPGKKVTAGTPKSVFPFEEALPGNRLGLASWVTDPDNPLTARVAVNRYWQMYFGKGLVTTPSDFGYQGQLPSHPELLDWLAREFIDSGWDVKAMQKRIVTSSAYKQSSKHRPDLEAVDPENTWIARGHRDRLTAEMIRNNALAASGLLVEKVGGPSVKPYQPPGLWIEKGTFSPALLTYEADTGEGLYRRSLYTFVKRTSPPPSMMAFDATDRSICTVERQTTSTPLQALILMNDPQYVEASRVLAERMKREGGDDPDSQIRYGYRLLTGKLPSEVEVQLFGRLYREEQARFASDRAQADSLLSVGDWPVDPLMNAVEIAALTLVANTMMNQDGAYMKR